jgi:hypothetical protein
MVKITFKDIKNLSKYTKVQNGIRYVFYACIVNGLFSA